MDKQAKNAGEVVTGLEQVVLDDSIHPFVANIKMSERQMNFYTVKHHHKKLNHIIVSDLRTIAYSKIVSIQHIQNTSKKYRKDDMKTLKFELNDAHFTRIFLRDKDTHSASVTAGDIISSVDLITCGFSRLHAQMMSLWHAQRLRAALCIDDQYGHTEADLAADYYRETVASLREVEKNKSPLADQVEILHEFADEVMSDIELKMICFQSKELFIMLFKMYDSVLAAPDHKMVHMKNKALVMTNLSSKKKADIEIEETIFKRLLLFHAILRVMHAILVSAQSIESRFDVLSWSRPLDLGSWVEVLLRDVHEELCQSLGYKFGALNDAEVNLEINKSFENVSISTPKRKKTCQQGQEGAFFSTNKITNVFSDAVLTPLRQRVQKQFSLFGVDHRSKLAILVRSIKDIQTMLAFCCVDACVTGRQAYQKNGDVVYPPPSLRVVEAMIRHDDWESMVEDVMIRISNILDDILVLDSVVRVITKRFWQAGQTPRFLSARASSSLAGSHVAPPPGLLATPPPTHRGHSFSFDSTHTSLHSPRLAAIPPLDRLRMSPSPRARSRKKPVKQASFKDLYQDSAAPGDHINTIFETQEVVLHNACCLIRILVLDHSKVRSFLVNDIDNHWFGIMHSMNLLFPRPPVPEEKVENDEEEKKDNKIDLFRRLFSKSTNQEKTKEKETPKSPPTVSTKSENDDKNQMKSDKEKLTKTGVPSEGEEEKDDEPLVTRLEKKKKQTAVVHLHEYGPPLYAHFTPASWEMCLLARIAIEDCIELLDLDIQFYSDDKAEEIEEERQMDTEVEKGEGKGGKALGGAIRKSYQKADDGHLHSGSTGLGGCKEGTGGLQSRLTKPPLNNASAPPANPTGAGTGAGGSRAGGGNNNSISMTTQTQEGHHYDVKVPILALPKRINDSFEKKLLSGNGHGNTNSSSCGGSDPVVGMVDVHDGKKNTRLASRFQRK